MEKRSVLQEIGTRMRHGDWEAASALIAEVSFESDDLIASGILHCAAAHGAPSEILTQLVMNKGFDVNHVFEYYTPLIGAIRGSHYETGKSLVELGANVNLGVVASSRSYTQSPLHAAIVRYSRNMCLLLLKHGASTTAKDIHGYSPLIAAIKMGQSEIAEDIIKFNADVNARVQKDETTPMIRAARRNLPIVCQRLLENGANVNHVDKNHLTALHGAAQSGSVDLCRLLIENGAVVNARSSFGDTPLIAVCRIYLGSAGKDIIQFLLASGAEVNARNAQGDSALHRLVFKYRYCDSSISSLLRFGADVYVRNNKGRSPINAAKDRPTLARTLESVPLLLALMSVRTIPRLFSRRPWWLTQDLLQRLRDALV